MSLGRKELRQVETELGTNEKAISMLLMVQFNKLDKLIAMAEKNGHSIATCRTEKES